MPVCAFAMYLPSLSIAISNMLYPLRYLLDLPAFDTKGIATGDRGVYLDVVYVLASKQSMDCRFHAAIRYIFRGKQLAAARIGFQSAWSGTKFLREAAVFRIALTSTRMDVDRTGLGKRFHAGKAVIGEQDAPGAGLDLVKTVTARSAVCPGFNVGGKSVDRRQQSGTNGFCDFTGDSYNPERLHGSSLF